MIALLHINLEYLFRVIDITKIKKKQPLWVFLFLLQFHIYLNASLYVNNLFSFTLFSCLK